MSIKNILALPSIFALFNILIGATQSRARFVRDFIKPKAGDKIFDIGCGMAEISSQLGSVDYYGFDISAAYIERARNLHGDGIKLFNEEFTPAQAQAHGPFDVGIAVGVQHHLSNAQLLGLLQTAKQSLRVGGRFITIDGCFVPGQSSIAKYILSKDRGEYVRDKEGYEKIVRQVFSDCKVEIHHDMLNIPYTHIIFESTKLA